MKEKPGVEIVLENVLETDPVWLLDIVKGVNDPRLRLCLDVGHVNAYSETPVEEWIRACAPYLSHFHVHNNDGETDFHRELPDGTIAMKELLHLAETVCPDATFTIETTNAADSIEWLIAEGLI